MGGREGKGSTRGVVRMIMKKEGRKGKKLKDACVHVLLHYTLNNLQCMELPFPWGSRHWGRGW